MGGARYPLVQGAAQQLPFAPASFDLVLCDHGGLSWAPPDLVVPQVARVLRRGGRLVFSVISPWFAPRTWVASCQASWRFMSGSRYGTT